MAKEEGYELSSIDEDGNPITAREQGTNEDGEVIEGTMSGGQGNTAREGSKESREGSDDDDGRIKKVVLP